LLFLNIIWYHVTWISVDEFCSAFQCNFKEKVTQSSYVEFEYEKLTCSLAPFFFFLSLLHFLVDFSFHFLKKLKIFFHDSFKSKFRLHILHGNCPFGTLWSPFPYIYSQALILSSNLFTFNQNLIITWSCYSLFSW